MGTPKALASLAAWRMVPSPPKHTSMSAVFSSSWVFLRVMCLGSSVPPPSTEKGRHMAVSTPTLRRIFSAAWAARSPLSR